MSILNFILLIFLSVAGLLFLIKYLTHISMVRTSIGKYKKGGFANSFKFIQEVKRLINNGNIYTMKEFKDSLFFCYSDEMLEKKHNEVDNIWEDMNNRFKFHASIPVFNGYVYFLDPLTFLYISILGYRLNSKLRTRKNIPYRDWILDIINKKYMTKV